MREGSRPRIESLPLGLSHSTSLAAASAIARPPLYDTTSYGSESVALSVGPFPRDLDFAGWSPIALLRRIVVNYPADPIHDQTQFLIGSLLEQDGNLTGAAAEFRSLIASRPKSKWASDCRAAIGR